jgi:hypothetical protein
MPQESTEASRNDQFFGKVIDNNGLDFSNTETN